ncbi:NAD-dependent epimerase/dehydratase family protein [Psychrobacter sp. AOP29-E1-4]|uniref:NAD-dependent epimerase/dehydratase family protein n=1 Tax=Psychrobacter sp. AOP29-E1-4 TaxID=3457703 RepID=UPI004034FD5D
MRLIVTGATGFIGRYLVESAQQHFEIICLTRSNEKNSENQSVSFVQTDYELNSLVNIFQEDDVLVHLAGQRLTRSEEEPKLSGFIDSNVKMTENLLLAACAAKIRQVVLTSTIGIYSEIDKTPYLEDTVTHPNTIYGLSKLMGEQLVAYYCRKNNVKSTIFRLSQCFGVGEKDSPVLMRFIKLARNKEKLTAQDNEFYLDEVYVKDVVEAIILSITKEVAGTFNVGGGKAYSILEMAETVNEVFDNTDNIEIISNIKIRNVDNFLSTQKIENQLNWTPKFNLKEALVDMRNTYNANKELK